MIWCAISEALPYFFCFWNFPSPMFGLFGMWYLLPGHKATSCVPVLLHLRTNMGGATKPQQRFVKQIQCLLNWVDLSRSKHVELVLGNVTKKRKISLLAIQFPYPKFMSIWFCITSACWVDTPKKRMPVVSFHLSNKKHSKTAFKQKTNGQTSPDLSYPAGVFFKEGFTTPEFHTDL